MVCLIVTADYSGVYVFVLQTLQHGAPAGDGGLVPSAESTDSHRPLTRIHAACTTCKTNVISVWREKSSSRKVDFLLEEDHFCCLVTIQS